MANDQDRNSGTGQESDISKSQATQNPAGQQGQQAEFGQQRSGGQADEGLQGETTTRQDTDIEGASKSKEKGEAESGFVGSQGQQDSSSELVSDEDEDFAQDGQGAPEGK